MTLTKFAKMVVALRVRAWIETKRELWAIIPRKSRPPREGVD